MNIYKLIVGSGADADKGLPCYVSGGFDTLDAAVKASEDLSDDDKKRAWIDIDNLKNDYVEFYETIEDAKSYLRWEKADCKSRRYRKIF